MANTKTMDKTITAKTTTSTAKVVTKTNVEKKASTAKKKKVYNQNDGIMCRSITTGVLNMIGIKSGIVYTWTDYADETEVEYADLVAAIRSNKSQVFAPYFIIEDTDFLESYPAITKIYDKFAKYQDFEEVFNLDVDTFKDFLKKAPIGVQNSIKSMAAKMVKTGELNNLIIIKALDEVLDTQLLLVTGMN